jgi:hypothetical protein
METPTATATMPAVPRGAVSLWLAFITGPVAAALQLLVNYALVKWACATGGEWVLGALTAVLLVVALGGAAVAARHLREARPDQAAADMWSADSRRLIAATAVGVDVLVALFLVNSAIAIAALTPCE